MKYQQPFSRAELTGDDEAIRHLKRAIGEGKHWYIALLEAIGLWTKSEEDYDGRHYRYLIGGEALDSLLLAERLCRPVDGLLPEKEKEELLISGKAPVELTREEFKTLIGDAKYQAYLNFFYGILVEEALLLAVEEEVRKEHTLLHLEEEAIAREAYQRIYSADMTTLLQRFRGEIGYPKRKSISLSEQKEFRYWLFKYRLRSCSKEKVASDTKKGLKQLKRQQRLGTTLPRFSP
jgi:hypothetical protein